MAEALAKNPVASAEPVTIPFKKRARKVRKKKVRKKKIRKPESAKDIGEEDEELNTLLSDVLMEQKTRARVKGVAAKSFKARKEDESDEDPDGYDPKVGGLVTKDKLALLDAQYTGATKALSDNENPHLLKYLDEKLKGNNNESPQTKKKTDLEKLYELPSDFQQLRNAAKGLEVSEDKALGGAVAFGTGIAEVELPIDYQLDNIEKTELAKAEFIRKQNSRQMKSRHEGDEMDGHGTGGHFGSNFRQHNRDYKKRKREEARRVEARFGHGDRPQNAAGPDGRVHMASDDMVMRRIWSRVRNARRM